MSIRIDNVNALVTRNTELPLLQSFTLMCWMNVRIDRGTNYCGMLTYGTYDPQSSPRFNAVFRSSASNGGVYYGYNGGSTVPSSINQTLNQWEHFCYVSDGVNLQFYINGSSIGSVAVRGDVLSEYMWLTGSNYDEWFDADFAAFKCWDRTLTVDQIQKESATFVPQDENSINAWTPLRDKFDTLDLSYRNNHWTVSGDVKNGTDNPPIVYSYKPQILSDVLLHRASYREPQPTGAYKILSSRMIRGVK